MSAYYQNNGNSKLRCWERKDSKGRIKAVTYSKAFQKWILAYTGGSTKKDLL